MRKGSLLFVAFMIAVMTAGIAASGSDPRGASRDKARYYYLEGLRHQVEGRDAQAYEYYKRAHQLDSSYTEAASAFGSMRLAARLDTLQSRQELLRSLRLMKPFVDEYPDDYNESLYYAFMASRIDTTPEAIRVFERTYSRNPAQTVILIHLSDAYMARGDYDKALEALDKYETIEGKSPQLTMKKISFRISRRDTVGALAETTSLVEYNPREPAYRILKGNMFEVMGENDSTLAYYKEAERLNPDYGAAKLALADYYRQQGDSAAYDEKTYEALLSEDFELEQKIGLLADYLQTLINDKMNTARGDSLFNVLRRQYPHEPGVIDLAARYSAAKGDYKDAADEISYAIDLSPTEEKYYGQLMNYQIAGDMPKEAMKTYREALKHIKPTVNIKVMYASAAQMADSNMEAVKAYRDIIRELAPGLPVERKLEPRDVPASLSYEDLQRVSQIFTGIGDALYKEKQLDSTFMNYDNALLLFPDNAMALNNYAYFLVESGGDIDRAAEMSEKSLEGEESENPTFLDTYAWILFKKGETAEAKKYQALAIEISEREDDLSSELFDHYGDILFANGDREEAVANWEKALEIEPDSENAPAIKKKIKDAR